MVARDLWAMLVAGQGVPPAPRDFEEGEEAAGNYTGPRVGARYYKKGRKRRKVIGKGKGKMDEGEDEDDHEGEEEDEKMSSGSESEKERRGSGGSSDGNRSDEEEEEEEEEDEEEIAERKREAELRKQARAKEKGKMKVEGFTNAYLPPKRAPKGSSSGVKDPRLRPRIDSLLVIIYLACVTLRLPVCLNDILQFVLSSFYNPSPTYLNFVVPSHLQSSRDPTNPIPPSETAPPPVDAKPPLSHLVPHSQSCRT